MAPMSAPTKTRKRALAASLDLFCIIIAASDLSQIVKSDILQALVAPPTRSVSVSTSVLSSARVEPPVAQLVGRWARDWEATQTGAPLLAPPALGAGGNNSGQPAPASGKIFDHSQANADSVDSVQQLLRRRQVSDRPRAAEAPQVQLLQPRRASLAGRAPGPQFKAPPEGGATGQQGQLQRPASRTSDNVARNEALARQMSRWTPSEPRGLRAILRG